MQFSRGSAEQEWMEIVQAMDTPGPQNYVALLGFSQKPKQRLNRGPFSSKEHKSPAFQFPVVDRAATPLCVEHSRRFNGQLDVTYITKSPVNEDLGQSRSTLSKKGTIFGKTLRRVFAQPPPFFFRPMWFNGMLSQAPSSPCRINMVTVFVS
jgi:hypothetical protein